MPLKKTFKILFFMLIAFSLLAFFLNSSLIFIFKGTSESIAKVKLTLPDYMFTIMYLINNFKHLLLLLSEDVEVNPGPERPSNIKFCHWNLNDLVAHDLIKKPLAEAFITSNNFGIVCLFESF